MKEQQSSVDFNKLGADLTLKAGKNSSLHVETANSDAGQDIDYGYSEDGGLTFSQRNLFLCQ